MYSFFPSCDVYDCSDNIDFISQRVDQLRDIQNFDPKCKENIDFAARISSVFKRAFLYCNESLNNSPVVNFDLLISTGNFKEGAFRSIIRNKNDNKELLNEIESVAKSSAEIQHGMHVGKTFSANNFYHLFKDEVQSLFEDDDELNLVCRAVRNDFDQALYSVLKFNHQYSKMIKDSNVFIDEKVLIQVISNVYFSGVARQNFSNRLTKKTLVSIKKFIVAMLKKSLKNYMKHGAYIYASVKFLQLLEAVKVGFCMSLSYQELADDKNAGFYQKNLCIPFDFECKNQDQVCICNKKIISIATSSNVSSSFVYRLQENRTPCIDLLKDSFEEIYLLDFNVLSEKRKNSSNRYNDLMKIVDEMFSIKDDQTEKFYKKYVLSGRAKTMDLDDFNNLVKNNLEMNEDDNITASQFLYGCFELEKSRFDHRKDLNIRMEKDLEKMFESIKDKQNFIPVSKERLLVFFNYIEEKCINSFLLQFSLRTILNEIRDILGQENNLSLDQNKKIASLMEVLILNLFPSLKGLDIYKKLLLILPQKTLPFSVFNPSFYKASIFLLCKYLIASILVLVTFAFLTKSLILSILGLCIFLIFVALFAYYRSDTALLGKFTKSNVYSPIEIISKQRCLVLPNEYL